MRIKPFIIAALLTIFSYHAVASPKTYMCNETTISEKGKPTITLKANPYLRTGGFVTLDYADPTMMVASLNFIDGKLEFSSYSEDEPLMKRIKRSNGLYMYKNKNAKFYADGGNFKHVFFTGRKTVTFERCFYLP